MPRVPLDLNFSEEDTYGMIKPDPFLDLIPRLDGEEPRAPSRADLDNPATVLAVRDDAGRAHLTRVGLADPFILSSARAIGVVDFMLIDDAQLEVLARQGEPC